MVFLPMIQKPTESEPDARHKSRAARFSILTHQAENKIQMAINKTIPNPLPPVTEQLAVVDDVTDQIESVARGAMDRQTANNRVGPGSDNSK